MRFCSTCGGPVLSRIPQGDNRERFVCAACSAIHYVNPRIVTGCLVTHGDAILLCRRNIEPRRGFWTFPAGFLETGKTIAEGAVRETLEEANARVELHGLYAVFNLPYIAQIYMFHRARLLDLDFCPGPESQEVQLFERGTIPWDELAFPVIRTTLERFFVDREQAQFPVHVVDLPRPTLPGFRG